MVACLHMLPNELTPVQGVPVQWSWNGLQPGHPASKWFHFILNTLFEALLFLFDFCYWEHFRKLWLTLVFMTSSVRVLPLIGWWYCQLCWGPWLAWVIVLIRRHGWMVGFGSTVATLGVSVDVWGERSSHFSGHGYPNANEISDDFGVDLK